MEQPNEIDELKKRRLDIKHQIDSLSNEKSDINKKIKELVLEKSSKQSEKVKIQEIPVCDKDAGSHTENSLEAVDENKEIMETD